MTNVANWPNIRPQNSQEPTTRNVSGRINLRPSFGRIFTKMTEKGAIFQKLIVPMTPAIYKNLSNFLMTDVQKVIVLIIKLSHQV
jgi:hypothetical protein